MTTSPILEIPEVDPNQTQKETTINTGIEILEASVNDRLLVDLTAGDLTLNMTQWTRYGLLILENASTATTVSVPATKRFIAIWNTGSASVTVKVVTGSGTTVIIPTGKIVLVTSDGTDIKALSSGVGALVDLSDVTIVSPAEGDLLTYDTASGKFVSKAVPGATLTIPADATTNFTLAATDQNTMRGVNNGSDVTITVPTNTAVPDYPIGETATFYQKGAGQIIISPAGGVTLIYPSDVSPKTRRTNSALSVTKLAANVWIVIGDLGA